MTAVASRPLWSYVISVLGFVRPWLLYVAAIIAWKWAFHSHGSDAAIRALLITIPVLAKPSYETLWPGSIKEAVQFAVSILKFMGPILVFLASYQAADGVHAVKHTSGDDQTYAHAYVFYYLIMYFYIEMTALVLIAVACVAIALSRVRPICDTLRMIWVALRRYWQDRSPHARFPIGHLYIYNLALVRSLTPFTCAICLGCGVLMVAVWNNQMANGGNFYVPSLVTDPPAAHQLAEDALYSSNAPLQYLDPDTVVPPDQLTCINFGRYDSIHRIRGVKVDVILRDMRPSKLGGQETRQTGMLTNVDCIPPPGGSARR
jgi:hypothetical protein